MTKNISVRKLRSNLAGVLKDVRTHLDRYVISRRGEPEAVLMCVDDYEGWLETLDIMSDKRTMAAIRKSQREIAEGKFYTYEEVFKRLSKKTKRRAA
jgi:antitoxin YefM